MISTLDDIFNIPAANPMAGGSTVGRFMFPLCLGIGIALLDQISKFLIQQRFALYESTPIIPGFFDLRFIKNTGAAWGLFAGGHFWLAALSVLVLAALIFFRKIFFSERLIDRLAYGFIIGGIVGNFIDRIRLNYVVDFLDFSWRNYHFPAFNVADAAICSGVALYMFSQALQARRTAAAADVEP